MNYNMLWFVKLACLILGIFANGTPHAQGLVIVARHDRVAFVFLG